MGASYNTFKTMLLRPAVYKGEEIEIRVNFADDSVFRTEYEKVCAMNMKTGDTAEIRGSVRFNDSLKREWVSIYMSGDTLAEFIDAYGCTNITAIVGMKAKLIYAVYNSSDFPGDEKMEEIVGFELLRIIPEKSNPSVIKLEDMTPEMKEYFMDGMK